MESRNPEAMAGLNTSGMMFPALRNGFPCFRILFISIISLTFAASISYAQDISADEIAPPPLKQISKAERSQLDAEPDVKKRTKLALELMDLRLKKAEELHTRQEFPEMFLELGGFHGLVDNTLGVLSQSGRGGGGKALDNFKRFEIGLRAFMPRLELIRRDLPLRYEFYLRNLAKYLRDARSKAIEPLFGDTVVPNKKT